MPEIIDILTPRINECPQFTVDTTMVSVPLSAFPGGSIIEAGGGTNLFSRGDNFILLSAGYFIPESFVMGEYPGAGLSEFSAPVMVFQGQNFGGGVISLNQVGSNGLLRIPFPRYEVMIGAFVSPEDIGINDAGGWYLRLIFPFTSGVDIPQVSMVGVPAALHGLTYHVVPFVKVLHNFGLV